MKVMRDIGSKELSAEFSKDLYSLLIICMENGTNCMEMSQIVNGAEIKVHLSFEVKKVK